jgi:general stress protein 26
MTQQATETTELSHFNTLLHSFNHAMLTTHSRNGELHSRPMIMAEVCDNGEVWLISDAHSEKIEELAEDNRVNVCMQQGQKWVALAGKATVVRDEDHVKKLWSEAWRVWFPQGPEDSSVVLIKVSPEQGEYWDNEGISRVKYLYETAKAYVTGTTPSLDKDIHSKVSLSN